MYKNNKCYINLNINNEINNLITTEQVMKPLMGQTMRQQMSIKEFIIQ